MMKRLFLICLLACGMTTVQAQVTIVKTGIIDSQEKVEGVYSEMRSEYTLDVSAWIPALVSWTQNNITTRNGQHWDGTGDSNYYENNTGWGSNTGWTASMTTTVTLPRGRYVLLVPARSAANVDSYVQVETASVGTAKGDTGLGIGTNGEPSFSGSATYANGGAGRGWQYSYIEFEVTGGGAQVALALGGTTSVQYQWMSFTQPRLLALPLDGPYTFELYNTGLYMNMTDGRVSIGSSPQELFRMATTDGKYYITDKRHVLGFQGNTITTTQGYTLTTTAAQSKPLTISDITWEDVAYNLLSFADSYYVGVDNTDDGSTCFSNKQQGNGTKNLWRIRSARPPIPFRHYKGVTGRDWVTPEGSSGMMEQETWVAAPDYNKLLPTSETNSPVAGSVQTVTADIRQGVHTWEYDVYMNPGETNRALILPLQYFMNGYIDYHAQGVPDWANTDGNDLEPRGYFRWYDWKTDRKAVAADGAWTLEACNNTNESYLKDTDRGLIALNLDPRHPVQNRVGVWFSTSDAFTAENYPDGIDIACDVSKFNDGIFVENGISYMEHEPTLSTRYIFHIYPGSKIADDMAHSKATFTTVQQQIADVDNTYAEADRPARKHQIFRDNEATMFAVHEDKGRVVVSLGEGNSGSFSLRLDEHALSNYKLWADDSHTGMVTADRITWVAFCEYGGRILRKELAHHITNRIVTFNYSNFITTDATNRNDCYHNIALGDQRDYIAVTGVTKFHVVGYVGDNSMNTFLREGIYAPVAHYELHFIQAPPLKVADLKSNANNVRTNNIERTDEYMSHHYDLQRIVDFDGNPETNPNLTDPVTEASRENEFFSTTAWDAAPTGRSNNMSWMPREWEEIEYSYCYPQLVDYLCNSDNANGWDYRRLLSPLHGDYMILKSMNNGSWSTDGDNWNVQWWRGEQLYDYTHTYTDESKYGSFLYTDASDESRTMVTIPFTAQLCAGSSIYVTAAVADMTDAQTKPQLLIRIVGIDADGKRTRLVAFHTCDIVSAGAGSGEWYQVYGHSTIPSDFDDTIESFICEVVNYASDTNGADFAIDQLAVYTNTSKIQLSQEGSNCDNPELNKTRIYIIGEGLHALYGENDGVKTIYWRLCSEDGSLVQAPDMYTYTDGGGVVHTDDGTFEYSVTQVNTSYLHNTDGWFTGSDNLPYFEIANKYLPGLEDGNAYYVSVFDPALSSDATENMLKANAFWGGLHHGATSKCSVFSSNFIPRQQFVDYINNADGTGEGGLITVDCHGEPVVEGLVMVLKKPDLTQPTGFVNITGLHYDFFFGTMAQWNSPAGDATFTHGGTSYQFYDLRAAYQDYRVSQFSGVAGLDVNYTNATYRPILQAAIDEGLLALDCSTTFSHNFINATGPNKYRVVCLPIEDYVPYGTDLRELYHEWNSVQANSSVTLDTPSDYTCNFGNTVADGGVIYGGGGGVPTGEYADLSGYERLIVTYDHSQALPRFIFNKLSETSGDSFIVESEGNYLSISGNVITINLARIVSERGFAHLNCIKAPWGDNATVFTAQAGPAVVSYDAICSPFEVDFKVVTSAPELALGFEDVEYPIDENGEPMKRVVRIGLEQLKNLRTGGYKLHVPVHDLKNKHKQMLESSKLLFTSSMLTLSAKSDDPTCPDPEEQTVNFAKMVNPQTGGNDAFVDPNHMYLALDLSGDNCAIDFHEGYSYEVSTSFMDDLDREEGNLSPCYSDIYLVIKVVPEFVTWNPQVIDQSISEQTYYNANWNSDANWLRSERAELYKDENVSGKQQNTKTFGHPEGYDNNREINEQLTTHPGFVPMKFTYVTLPEACRAPSLISMNLVAYNNSPYTGGSILAGDLKTDPSPADPTRAVSSDATANIKYDMLVRYTETTCQGHLRNDKKTVYHGTENGGHVYDCEKFYGNICREIYFKPEAELINQQRLTYGRAWVEKELTPNQWYLMSAPLRGTYAGDMYVPTSMTNVSTAVEGVKGRQLTEAFQPISFSTTATAADVANALSSAPAYSRTRYPFYQHSWDHGLGSDGSTVYTEANDVLRSDYTADLPYSHAVTTTLAQWSHVFNDVQVKYDDMQGFAIRAHKQSGVSGEKALLRLPKADQAYTYYDYQDGVGATQPTPKSPTEDYGRFVTDGGDNKATLAKALEQPNVNGDNHYYLVGNPYMSSIDMGQFFAKNPQFNGAFWKVNGAPSAGLAEGIIKPMESFFVKVANNVDLATEVAFDNSMMVDGNATNVAAPSRPRLMLTASSGTAKSTALLMLGVGTQADYAESEDVETLFDSNTADLPVVYTVAGSQAVSIDQRPGLDVVPFGVAGAGTTAPVEVRLTGVADVAAQLYVIDALTGDRQEVGEGSAVSIQPNDYGRYFLVGEPLTLAATALDGGIVVRVRGNEVMVVSTGDDLTCIDAVTPGGAKAFAGKNCGRTATFHLQPGVYIIEARTASSGKTLKVVVR